MDLRNQPSDEAEFDCDEARSELVSEEFDDELKSDAQNALELVIASDDGQFGDLLDEPAKKEAMTRVVMTAMMQRERHRGPLPSPRQLSEYEQCLPGTAERIVAMAEKEQTHRHATMDGFSVFRNDTLVHVKNRDSRGQYLGALMCAGVIGLCFYMVNTGSPASAATLAGATLVGLAGVFVTRQRKAHKTDAPDLAD